MLTMEATETHVLDVRWTPATPAEREPEHQPEYISTSEAARRAGVSASTVRRWIRRGYLDATRSSTGYLVDASGLEAARARARGHRSNARRDTLVSEHPAHLQGATAAASQARTDEGEAPMYQTAAPSPPTTEERAPIRPGSTTRPAPRARVERRYRLEGLQRSIVLEQAKYLRAARRRDAATMRDSAWRLEVLYQQLADAQHEERQRRTGPGTGASWRGRVATLRSSPAVTALATTLRFAKAAPSRRTFNFAMLLLLNGVLLMLMSFVA